MISRFFAWLGRVFSTFISWLGSLISSLYHAFVDSMSAFFDYILGLINSIAGTIYTYILSLLPESELVQAGVSALRSCWVVADQFVPLSEGFTLILAYFAFYVSIKVIGLVVRIALAITP